MNVAVLSALFAPLARGGAERVAEVSARALTRRGCRVSVVTLASPGATRAEQVEDDGLRIHRLPCPNRYHPLDAGVQPLLARLQWHVRDLETVATVAALGRILDSTAADAVVSHNLKGLGLRCVAAIRARGLPHVHVLHDLQLSVASGVLWAAGPRRPDAYPCVRRWHERRVRPLVGSPAAVVAPSQYLLREHLERGFFPSSRTAVLRNPIAPVPAVPAVPRSGGARFLFAGQVVEHKGVRVLLQAWAAARPPAAELHIAGDGPLAAEVAAQAARDPSIVCHGRVDATALQTILADSDAVIVPSLWHENAPMTVLEALAAGCAVVASRVGGIPELVSADCGLLVPPGEAPALTAAMAAFDRDLAWWRSRRAVITARRHGPTPDEYAAELLALLRPERLG